MARTLEQVAASSEELTASAHQSVDAAVCVAETVGEVSQNPLADSGMLPFLYIFLRLVNLDRAGKESGGTGAPCAIPSASAGAWGCRRHSPFMSAGRIWRPIR